MDSKDEEFLSRLRLTFKDEAREHLQTISEGLEVLRRGLDETEQKEQIEVVFRAAHSLKGAARSVNLPGIETICQSMESVFASLKKQPAILTNDLLRLLHDAVDMVTRIVDADFQDATGSKGAATVISRRLESAAQGRLISTPAAHEPEPAQTLTVEPTPVETMATGSAASRSNTIRVATSRLDKLLLESEEMLALKLMSGHRAEQLKNILSLVKQWDKDWIRIAPYLRRARQSQVEPLAESELTGLLEFLDWNQEFIGSIENRLSKIMTECEQEHRTVGSMVDTLLLDVRQTVMFPFATLVEGFPNLVRSLAQDQGKEAELIIQGEHLEIDRRILEGLKDPIIHVLRNSIDHGLEKPNERLRNGKPSRGTITISVSQHSSTQIELLISDDGRGIDIGRVREMINRLSLMPAADAAQLSDNDVLPFIFHSGLSTSPAITDISGRGLGLAILQNQVEKLGGTISVETRPRNGSTFRLLLPLSVATFRAVLVSVNGQIFAVPTNNVERVLRLSKNDIRTVENRETIRFDGRILPLVSMAEVLEMNQVDRRQPESIDVSIIVLNVSGNRIAFRIDEILSEQEVLVKNLGKQLSRVRNIAGATVLGTGTVVPILNVRDLMKSALRPSTAARLQRQATRSEQAKARSILLAEDSITSRALLKNILESAGYYVQTAVDGVDAFTRLKTEQFDLLVSDVEMPRMNGFDLTARVRADKALANLPIVLVTALASREDREKGVDAGANAYIVKSDFDQSDLLEVIARMV
jgi:two-component system chemotaxis sensor kinase CheA